MYNNKEYWSKRELSDTPNDPRVEKYIKNHLQGESVLDFGVGNGKKLHLYEKMYVTGCDISDKYKNECMKKAGEIGMLFVYYNGELKDLVGKYDTIVCSKVLLHIPENEIQDTVNELKKRSSNIIVWDIDRPDGAEHVFNHDFSKLFDMKNVIRKDQQILFTS